MSKRVRPTLRVVEGGKTDNPFTPQFNSHTLMHYLCLPIHIGLVCSLVGVLFTSIAVATVSQKCRFRP